MACCYIYSLFDVFKFICRDQVMGKLKAIPSLPTMVMRRMKMNIAKPFAVVVVETIMQMNFGSAAMSARGGSMGSVWRLLLPGLRALNNTNVHLAWGGASPRCFSPHKNNSSHILAPYSNQVLHMVPVSKKDNVWRIMFDFTQIIFSVWYILL